MSIKSIPLSCALCTTWASSWLGIDFPDSNYKKVSKTQTKYKILEQQKMSSTYAGSTIICVIT